MLLLFFNIKVTGNRLQYSYSIFFIVHLTFSYIRLIPESPSWLYSRKRFSEFQKVMKKIAMANGTWNSELELYLENVKVYICV